MGRRSRAKDMKEYLRCKGVRRHATRFLPIFVFNDARMVGLYHGDLLRWHERMVSVG